MRTFQIYGKHKEVLPAVLKGHVHAENHVEAPVAVRLGAFDVVLADDDFGSGNGFDEFDIVVNVIQKAADDADADCVMDIIEHRLRHGRKALPLAFLPHAVF